MGPGKSGDFDIVTFLSRAGIGRKLIEVKPKQSLVFQGSSADAIYLLQRGRMRLRVASKRGKMATLAILGPGDFLGQESFAEDKATYMSTAEALTHCTVVRIERKEAVRAVYEERVFADLFLNYMVSQSVRIQADFIDQIFNPSEKRLARTLLLLAHFGDSAGDDGEISEISQEALAEMVGTTRSRVSYFMNRFRKEGFIDYSGHRHIHVHKGLMNVILHD